MEESELVKNWLGAHLLKRLGTLDWIKSPELYNFGRPMAEDPPKYRGLTDEEIKRIEAPLAALPADATSLDGFEYLLAKVGEESVSGIAHWFAELGGAEGYAFDQRFNSLIHEFRMMAPMLGRWKIEKMAANGVGAPDYRMTWQHIRMFVDAKRLFGKSWPLKVFRTMIHAIKRYGGFEDATRVMVLANPGVEGRLDSIDAGEFIGSVLDVATGVKILAPVGGVRVIPRTALAERLGVYASYRPLNSEADCAAEIESWKPNPDLFFDKIVEGWRQAEKHVVDHCDVPVVALSGELLAGHPNLADNDAQIRSWLTEYVWPDHHRRALMVLYEDQSYRPEWYVEPRALAETTAAGGSEG